MTSAVQDLGSIESAIVDSVSGRVDEWFPGRRARTRVRLRKLSARPRSVTYAVLLDVDDDRPYVLAKVRRGEMAPAADKGATDRPRLAPSLLGNAELTAWEYGGLVGIFEAFQSLPGFSAVRPLEHLVHENTILMDYVEGRTLRSILGGHSRFSVKRMTRRVQLGPTAWQRAGAWLRLYQRSMPIEGVPARQSTKDQVVDRLLAYQDYLASRLGPRTFPDLGRRGAELASAVLPDNLDMAVGHGDFAPRNALLRPDGALAVFDPMPRWVVPRYEDVSRFLVGLHLVGPQVLTHGAAYGRQQLDSLERAVLRGYFAADQIPHAQLRCFELLVVLDTWAQFVSTPRADMRSRLRGTAVDMAAGHLRRTAQRMVDLAEANR